MGSDSASDSQDSHDDDDEEEYQESRRGNRLLGFMFGNVDNTGDLDADYLDEDAKEHLAALADKLGSSLADIALSVRSSRTPANAAEQDYDEKAEDAVDYEDIDEQYEGPEIQAATEEDLLPEKEYVSAGVPFINLQNSDSIFDDENYDEDEEPEKEPEVAVQDLESQPALSDVQAARPEGELSPVNEQAGPSPVKETSEGGFQEIEYTDDDLEETPEDINFAPLPVLCVENGSVILKFSEIFGIQEATRRRYNRDHMYLVPRERLKFIDCPDAVEEDEESFLRGFAHGSMQEDHTVQDNTLNTIHYVNKSGKIDHWQNDSIYSVKTDEEMLDDFLEAPMKEDITIDLSTLWKLPQSPNFYPLDQQDWEDSILWDSNSLVPDSPRKVQEIAVPDNFEKAADLDFGEEDHQNPVNEQLAELPMQSSLSAAMTSNLLLSNKVSHPQLLRLECQMEVDNSSQVDGSERQRHDDDDDTTRPIKDLPQNQYILEGSWLNNIIWGPDTAVTRPKFILDLQDTRMLFEVLDNKDNDKFWLHARAMVIAHSLDLSKHSLLELPGQGNQSDGRFDIANDVFYSNRKTNQQLNSGTEKRSGYGIEVYHSAAALKLETMKLKLSNKDLANFHRPKAVWFPHDNVVFKEQKKLPMLGPMKIIVKSLGGKGSKLHVDTEETISSVKAKASKKLDFKPIEAVKIFYRGKELEDLQTLSAQNVQPNSLLHVVRTKLHLLPKAQKIPSENKSLRPPGAFKKKSDLSLKDGHVFLMEYCEERPLLLSNAGMGARLCTYYQKTAPSDQNGNLLSSEIKNFGSLLVLDTTDKSPFLGDLKPGGTQSSLETNMFRAPVFPHKVSSTDYLLVRSAKGKLSLRRIDKINVVGQQEPLMEVMSPANKDLQPFLMKRVVVYMFRAFRALKKRNLTPHVLVDELASQFPNLSEVFLRNRLKKHGFADLKRGPTGQWIWKMRSNIQIPSEEFLRKLVSPEKVCAYESMQAGLYRLKHLGIMKLLNPAGLSNAMSRLPNEAIALAGASHIERELQITPWNLSSNFVACTNQVRENLERLEISGVGDPSGRGLGFSYVRATPKAPISNAVTKKKAAAAKGGTTVTGTDADLRRLSMEAAREVLIKFNVPDEVIAKQTRWHRIAMIRELSSEQAALGVKVDPTTIGKFARGQRISFVQQQQQTRERCQEIWDRQVQSLIVGGDEGASDSESNSDLDSFAGDLENLLDAEDFEDDDEAVDQTTNDRSEGAKAHKMRRHPSQVETDEKVEDEAAEAAELCRMLMDDDENDWLKKKKAGSKKEIGSSQIAQLGFASENVERIKKPKKVVKQLSSSVFFDGASIPSENAHGDKDDVEMLLKKNIPPKMPKVKILGEVKGFKEKKSARESFVCGACGQLGHMRTNKHCPRYGEEIDSLIEPNKTSGKSAPLNPSIPSHLKSAAKKPTTKKKIAPPPSDATEVDKSSSSKPKPLKLKCLTSEKNVENSNVEPCSDHVPTSSINKPSVKVSKIVISNKMKPDPPLESNNKPSIVIRPPMADTDQGFTEDPRPSIVIKPPVFAVENHAKPLIVIRPPTEVEQEQSHKRIVIKRPREILDLDPTVHDEGGVDFGFRKVKKIVELSDLDSYGRQESLNYSEPSSKRKGRDWEHQRSWEEEEKRRRVEERKRRLQIEEQEKLMELERFEDTMREDREEEMRIKAARKKMKRPEPRVEYVDDFRAARRNGRRSAHEMTDRLSRRSRPDNELRNFVTDLGPPTKRRRGGKVGLANILEHIVETLRARQEVSYLFLKPVTKKEAPDYLKFVSRPMDLSTIREKVRKFEYKNRKQFRRDVCQITINAHIYNDQRNPGIPPLGDQLLELCDYMLYENSDSLDEVEVGIEQTD